MAKRIFALILALAVVMTLIPPVALAEGTEQVQPSPNAGAHTEEGHSAECGAHCSGDISWTAWDGDVSKLSAGGHYYLTDNTTLTQEVTVAADLHLCLNGFVLTAAENARLMSTKDKTQVALTISDCTAYTEEDTLYAGAITGGNDTSSTGGGALFVRCGSVINLYNIRLLNNDSKTTGGALLLQATKDGLAGGRMNVTGCLIAGNQAVNGTTLQNGGAVRMGEDTVLTVVDTVFAGNNGKNGAAIFANGGELNLENCTFSDHSGDRGGAIRADNTDMTVDGCTFTGNSGSRGGAIYTGGQTTLQISGSTFTENTATTAGAVMYMGGKTVQIQDSRFTGNVCSNTTAGGAVYMGSDSCKLTLSGNVYIADNTVAGAAADLVLYYAANDTIYVNGLAEGSYVKFSTPATAAPAATDLVAVEGTQDAWDSSWLVFQDATGNLKPIGKNDTGFVFAEHTHCVCGEESCTEHTQVTYTAWDGDVSKLSAGGKYYLIRDVQLSAEAVVKGNLDLCLCGHTLTAPADSRHFSTKDNGNVTITIADCEAALNEGVYTAGKLTGGNSAENGGSILIAKGNKLYMYDGILIDNDSAAAGGAIQLNGNAECYLYGGQITGNTATGNGGAINTSGGSRLTLNGVTIKDNTTQRYGGAVYVNNTAVVTVSGDTIVTGNKRNTATNNLHLGGTTLLQLENVGENALVGVTASVRAISGETTDVSAHFPSDSTDHKIIYKDGVLHYALAFEHEHCQCGKTDCTDTTHEKIAYKEWKGTTDLPTSGNYCLTENVQLSAEVELTGDLNLCLHGKTLTAPADSRHFSTKDNGNVTITIADCEAALNEGVYTAGKLTGGNSAENGGSILIAKGNKLYMYDGILSDNVSAAAGGAIQLNGNAECYLYGGQITGNTATGNGGAINTSGGSRLTLNGVTIKDNTTQRYGGAVYVSSTAVVTVSGDTIVTGNKRNTATNNLHLGGTALLQLENVGENALVGVTASERAISGETTDVSAHFPSDSTDYKVIYKDGVLHYVLAFEHEHCQCGKTDCTDPTHEKISYKEWKNANALPSSGNYCLGTDVTISKEVTLKENLNLCLCGHKVTGATGKVRFYSTNGKNNEVLNITDCTAKVVDGVYTAGGFYNNTNTDTEAAGGAIYIRAGGTLNFYEGIVSGCSSAAGGAAFYGKQASLNIYNGSITGNKAVNGETWKNGGAFYLSNSSLTIYGGSITGNEAGNGAAIYTAGSSKLDIRGGQITGNKTCGKGGAIHATNCQLLISGSPMIIGNQLAAGGASNLYLSNSGVMTLTDLGEAAKIGVNASAQRVISTETQNYTKNVLSDDSKLVVVYRDKVLYTEASGDHRHCLCGGSAAVGCDHTVTTYVEWDDPTSLPASGNYYLSVDVAVTKQASVKNGTLNLCLNGHTIRAAKEDIRIYYLDEGGTLNISDCAGGGKLTDATKAAILTNSNGTDMHINLYGGSITGNRNATSGGGIAVQGGCECNMYGGSITNNSVESSLVLDENGKPVLDEKGSQTCNAANGGGLYLGVGTVFNMYGGEISGNTTKEVDYLKAGDVKSYAGGSGGAMYVRGIANLYGGKITDNTAKLGGGALVYGKEAEVNVMGTEIIGNHASSGGGLISQSESVINMKSGAVSKNTATSTGGGIYVSTGTTLNMTGGTVSGNIAANGKTLKNGAGIYLLAGTANISGGEISGHEAANGAAIFMCLSGERYPTLTLSGDVLIKENTATSAGGAISATGEGTTITMSGGTISNNTAKNGGGVIIQTKSVFTMTGGKITGNRATSTGGGLYVSTGTSFHMAGGSIDANHATTGGGGICLLRSAATFKGGSVSSNTAENHAGIRVSGATVTIHNLNLVGNKATGKLNEEGKYTGGNGGGLFAGQLTYNAGGTKQIALPKITIYNIYAANNTANNGGGAMLIQSKGTEFTMYGGTFANNTATGSGGALYISTNVVANISGGSFTGNAAKAAAAINFLGCQAALSNITFRGNTAQSQGGVCVIGRDTANVTMKNVEMCDNVSKGAAGAVLVQNYAKLQVEDSKFTGNSCETSGGAIYFGNPCYTTFQNVEFTGNRSTGIGGAIHVHANADVTMDNVTVSDNVAEGGYGGGISTRGRLVLTNSKVLNNKCLAGEGGGIGTFRANSMYLADDNGLFATNVVISGNESSLQGGGIYGHRGGPVYLENCTITDNIAKGEGGGIYSDGRFSLIDSVVTDNTSENGGYAVYMTAAEYDGHSYSTGFKKLGGNVIVRDNKGGDLYIGEGTGVAAVGQAIGEKAYLDITLHSGVLSEHLFGVYHYEGGNLKYIVTAGNRSITDPEEYQYYQEPVQQVPTEPEEETVPGDDITADGSSNGLLFAGIGASVLVVAAAVVLIALKKKKAGKSAKQDNQK